MSIIEVPPRCVNTRGLGQTRSESDMQQSKTCTKCKQSQPIEQFNRDKNRQDGRFPHCKSCNKASHAEHYKRNADSVKEKVSAYSKANPEKVAAYRTKWRSLNEEKNREYQRLWAQQYRKNNPLHHRKWKTDPAKLREWRANNPDKVILQKQRRRMRELGVESFLVTSADIRRILNSPCTYCGSTKSIQVDHVIPLAKGGRHSVGNLAPACMTCNVHKSSKFITQWKLDEMKAS